MGKVFSPEEIEGSRVPDIGDHLKFGQQLLSLTHDITGVEFPIVGAMVHGSTVRLEANKRSDVDFLAIVPDNLSAEDFQDYVSVMHCEAWVRKIAIEPIIMTKTEATAGDHTIDTLFLDYLSETEASGNPFTVKPSSGESLTGLITPCEPDPLLSLKRYIVQKKEKFTKVSPDSIDYRDMQRALELPRAFERRFMQAFGQLPQQASDKLAQQLAILTALDTEYTTILDETLRGEKSLKYYMDALEEMNLEAISAALAASLEALSTVTKNT